MSIKRRIAAAVAAAGLAAGTAGVGSAAAEPELPPMPQLPAFPQFTPDQLMALQPMILPAPNNDAITVNPDTRENFVAFGDSAAANVTAIDIVASKAIDRGIPVAWPNIGNGNCAQGADSFPVKTAQRAGLRLSNYTCAGAVARADVRMPSLHTNSVTHQVDLALKDGALTGDTKLVTITAGMNDTYQAPYGNPAEYGEYDDEYVRVIGDQVRRIREAAPNARVVITGYPDQTDGHGYICQLNAGGLVTRTYYPLLDWLQKHIRTAQQRTADEQHVDFYDAFSEIDLGHDNNACSPNPNRLSSAWVDDQSHALAGHLTSLGNDHYAEALAARANH
ncbi:GDSL-type esterase/lipase family protein [Corynebacterium bovis]|uniref:GDSL-type esterase/lipase family protein n=1 Tax=Corynebacterium bovis TaxID=36808 RepID=UPI002447ABB1|nr:GDSL-type esterase/lipase family protein [Corynebacterium bovis]